MDTNTLPARFDPDGPMLRLAVAAYLARYKGQTRAHTAATGSRHRRADEWLVAPRSALKSSPIRESG